MNARKSRNRERRGKQTTRGFGEAAITEWLRANAIAAAEDAVVENAVSVSWAYASNAQAQGRETYPTDDPPPFGAPVPASVAFSPVVHLTRDPLAHIPVPPPETVQFCVQKGKKQCVTN